MAATSIVLADALATPVNHTFIPIGNDQSGVFLYADQSPSSEIGYNLIKVSDKKPNQAQAGQSSAGRMSRVKVSLDLPVLETLSTNDAGLIPPPTVAYIVRCNVEFLLPERASLQDRKNIRKMVANLLANSDIISVVETRQRLS